MKLAPIIIAAALLAGCADYKTVNVSSYQTRTEGVYIDTDQGMFSVCKRCHRQDPIVMRHNSLKDRNPKVIAFCFDHENIVKVVPADETETKPDVNPIVYNEVTPRGIAVESFLSAFTGMVALVLVWLLSVWLGYRIARAGR